MAGRAPAPTVIEGVGTNVTFAYGPGDLISCPSKLTGTALIKLVKATKRVDRGGAPISWIGLRALRRGQILGVESIHSTDPFEVIKAAEQTRNQDPLPDYTYEESRARIEKFTVAELRQFCITASLNDKGLKPALKDRIFTWFRENRSKFPPVADPPPPVETEAPASPPLNEEDEAGDSERPAAPAPSVAAPSHVPPPPPPPTTREEVAYGFLMADANDLRVGDIIAAWKINGDIGVESNLHYGRVVFISPDEIRTHPSMADCSIVPTSGRSRLRVCARRVPSGPFVINPLPHLFPVDVNDGHVDAKLDRRMGAPNTMKLVQGHDPRWMKLADAAAEARATEHQAQVDGAAFNQADDDGNFPPNLFAGINNLKENAVKKSSRGGRRLIRSGTCPARDPERRGLRSGGSTASNLAGATHHTAEAFGTNQQRRRFWCGVSLARQRLL